MLFETIRNIIFPFSKLEDLIPKEGTILDVGCGHGVFSKLLASNSNNRRILGIDPSAAKIKSAGQDLSKYKNLKFQVSTIENLSPSKFNTIITVDVLYLLPLAKKIEFIKKVKQMLKKDGLFILKEVDQTNTTINKLIEFEEFLMVKIFKKTYSEYSSLNFISIKSYIDLLKKEGFKIDKVKKIRGLLPYPHTAIKAHI